MPERNFTDVLVEFLNRSGLSSGDIDRITTQLFGEDRRVPKQTIVSWQKMSTRPVRPRDWEAVVKTARALRLQADETELLLRAAGYNTPLPELSELATDPVLQKILKGWNANLSSAGRDDPYALLRQMETASTEQFHAGIQVLRKLQAIQFIGREEELRRYANSLNQQHRVVITGFPGMGKSTLAAKLARQMVEPKKVLWFEFGPEDGIDRLLYAMAAFLSLNGKDDLRRLMFPIQGAGVAMPLDEAAKYLLAMFNGKDRFLVCLDNIEQVENNQRIVKIIQDLEQLAGRGTIYLIEISRNMPRWTKKGEFEILEGFNLADTRRLLLAYGLELDGSLIERLYAALGGNPNLILLAVDAIRHTQDISQIVIHLMEAEDIERYLMETVYEALSTEQRAVMSAIAILGAGAGTTRAIEAVLAASSFRPELIQLVSRNLLGVEESPLGKIYRQQASVRAFYEHILGSAKKGWHLRAAEFYTGEEQNDRLSAAQHYFKGGDPDQAARLVSQAHWDILNQGRAQELFNLLVELAAAKLDRLQQAEIELMLGDIAFYLGSSEPAEAHYAKSLQILQSLAGEAQVQEYLAQAYFGMACLYEFRDPEKALEAIRAGLEQVAGARTVEEASLHLKAGSLYIAINDLDAATRAIELGMAILPPDSARQKAGGLMNLATIDGMQGKFDEAAGYLLQARDIYEEQGDQLRLVDVWTNLGMIKDFTLDWPGAMAEYQRALKTAEKLGNITQQARLNLNLGFLAMNQGNDEQARAYTTKANALAHQADLVELEINSLVNLGQLALRRKEFALARDPLSQAKTLAEAAGAPPPLQAEILRNLAEMHLGFGQRAEGLAALREAMALIEANELDFERGIALRISGQQNMPEDAQQGLAMIEASYTLLQELDLFEAARTLLMWGEALLLNGERGLGKQKLLEAKETFAQLNAKRELESANRLLSAIREN